MTSQVRLRPPGDQRWSVLSMSGPMGREMGESSPETNGTKLRTVKASLFYGRFQALRDITLDIPSLESGSPPCCAFSTA